jgi:serine/threonine protein kinase
MTTTREEIRGLLLGTGKYDLGQENEEGANAYAFRARHLPLNLDVFLKVYAVDPASSDLFNEPRFLVEATNSDGRSGNLVRVHDAELLGSEYVLLAMELVEGGSILSRLSSGALPLMESVRIAVGILHGLAQLHGGLLVHRDIKPANVLLAERYGRPFPKITDFGSVARLAAPGDCVTASRHSALYVPPEGWGEPSRYDVRSDIYQVGLVLYEMAHGPLPYNDEAYMDREANRCLRSRGCSCLSELDDFDRCDFVNETLARIASNGGITSFVAAKGYVPNRLTRIINKATHPDPTRRYQTASEMIGDLEPLNLPNWTADDVCCAATGWNSWDWRIEPDGASSASFVVLRSRAGAEKYRRWTTANTLRAASQAVLEAG